MWWRQNFRNVFRNIGQLGQIHQISMQRLMIGHAFVHFAEILEILNSLNEAAIVVQNFLNMRCTWRWWWRHPGRSSIIRWHYTLLIWRHGRRMLLRRLLRLLLSRSVRHRHFSFVLFRRLFCYFFFFSFSCGWRIGDKANAHAHTHTLTLSVTQSMPQTQLNSYNQFSIVGTRDKKK